MKMIIDIPDKLYGLLKYFEDSLGLTDKKDSNDDVKTALIRAVIHGTPLPKEHGRLIDADALESHDEYDSQGFTKSVYKDDIDLAPTIIEGSDSNDR